MKNTTKAVLLASLSFGFVTGSPVSASAQDLIPADNGIFTYHQAPRYRESEGHPLRLLGYVLHPIGWVAREAITRPISAFAASSRVTRSVMGFREPFDFRSPYCFQGGDEVPDCHKLPPMNSLAQPSGVATEEGTANIEKQSIYFPDIAFEFDKSSLNSIGKGRVRQVAQLLASVPSVKVVVEGHTDIKGSDEYNQKLGMTRAQTVVKELSDLGIDPARMSPMSYGESRPVFTEDEDWARAINRRVQFTVASGSGDLAPAAEAH